MTKTPHRVRKLCAVFCVAVYLEAVSYTHLDVYKRQLLVCVVLGIPLLLLIRRMKLDERFFSLVN